MTSSDSDRQRPPSIIEPGVVRSEQAHAARRENEGVAHALGSGAILLRRLVTFAPLAAGTVAVATALLVLAGWAFDVASLRSIRPSFVTMKPNAAVAFLASGLALLAHLGRRGAARQRLAMSCAGLTAAVGLLTLAEYAHVPGIDIDHLLFQEGPSPVLTSHPGRMAPATAACFILLGSAMLLGRMTLRGHWPSGLLVAPVIQISLLGLIGYACGVETFYGLGFHTAMALHTAALFLLLSVGLVCMRPQLGFVAILTSTGAGGAMARSLLGAAVLAPFAAGWLLAEGSRAGLFSFEFALAFFAMASIGLFMGMVWLNGFLLERVDAERSREMEERLRSMVREESLREADRRKEDFLAVLSHELRNPLASMRNSLFILDRAAAGGEQARRALGVIDRQVSQLSRLVEDLLNVSRIGRGKIQLQKARVDLTEVAWRSVEDLRSTFSGNGVDLGADIPGEALWVHGDSARLAQVFGNLLQNAAKFTPRGGHVLLTLDAEAPDRAARIRVRDTGVGFEPALRERLFNPFEQADRTLVRSQGGLGLGLALVKGLVEMHGGTVEALSEGPGKGAEFVVHIPLEAAPDASVARN
jgi:signal transduction histidine kinase